jgi:senataxin
MLTTLTLFFQAFSTAIWNRLTPYTPLNLVDLIFANISFEDILLQPSHSPDGDLSTLLEWLPAMMTTLSDHAKVQISAKALFFCFEKFNHTRFPETARIFCLGEGMRLLRGVMEDCVANEMADRDVDLALKLEVIQVVDKYTSIIIRTAKPGDARATRVLGLRLSLDCRILESEMTELIKPDVYRGRVIPTFNLAEMWKVVKDGDWTDDDTDIIRSIFAAVGRAAVLDLLDSKVFEGKDAERVKRFSKGVFELQRMLVPMFTKMSDIRPRTMRLILEDDETCSSVVAHLFNAKRQNLENADLDMLKTAFDVPGKTDVWKQLLRVSFDAPLRGICKISRQILNIQRIIMPEKLRPWHRGYLLANVGKVIRQSMQVVDILCSGRSGILTTTDILSQSDSHGDALRQFWRTFWDVLNVAFLSATVWAESEDKDVMKNFLRDVLEGASVLFDALKVIDSSLSGTRYDETSPVKATTIQQSLLKDVQIPLQSLSKWLRLNTEELRETTLNLASRILKRFARAEVQVAQDTLVDFYRLSHGKKKNNMSEDQRERLLFVLSEHDVEPNTRKAVEAMAATRATGSVTPLARALTPELTKVKSPSRQVIDLSDETEYLNDYMSDSELNAYMDKFDKKTVTPKPTPMKQTKLDFSKGVIKPPTSTNMARTSSAPTKTLSSKPPAALSNDIPYLRANFKADRKNNLSGFKARRAPVAAPRTDAFGRPLDAAGQVIEAPRAPPKNVEESSSSEDEEDEDSGGLFSIAKENRSPPKVRKIEKRGVQLLGEPVRSRAQLKARDRELRRVPSERNIRARLDPDLTPLLKRVLSWKPGHSGAYPPGTKEADYKRVAATFSSPNKYAETFEPLLMLECWQHIQQSKSESLGESFDVLVENRQKVDDYVDLFVTMKTEVYSSVILLDPDLVIISNQKTGGKECFAKVQGIKKKKETVDLALRCIPSSEMAAFLVPKATVFGVKLFRYRFEFSYEV